MAEKWRESREMNDSLRAEARALERAFRYYEELGFKGEFCAWKAGWLPLPLERL